MKNRIAFTLISSLLISCNTPTESTTRQKVTLPIVGTWQLISGTLIENGDTVITDYTKGKSFIKIISETNFAFLGHDLNKGKGADSLFTAGGGQYILNNSLYTEQLQYCNDRQWEGNDFNFIVTIQNDTLIQTGEEKIESTGVNRLNIEKYARVKK